MNTHLAVHADVRTLYGIISEAEITRLDGASTRSRRHPLLALVSDIVDPDSCTRTTIQAMRFIHAHERAWMDGLRVRLLDTNGFTNAAAALGELRAYGTLAMAGLRPKPSARGNRYDFHLECDGRTVVVEVHTRQIDEAAKSRLDTWVADQHATEHAAGISVSFSPPIAPFGEPNPDKPGDTVIANMVSRIAATKAIEHQFKDGLVNVLWLDFRSGPISMLVDTSAALPFASRVGRIHSGALWYAAYGTCGLPIIESIAHGRYVIVAMGHDGRLRTEKTKLSAIVAACNDGFVLLEHPKPSVPLPPFVRNSLLMHMDFRAERSTCAWGQDSECVTRAIEAGEQSIHAVCRDLKTWPFVSQDGVTTPKLSAVE